LKFSQARQVPHPSGLEPDAVRFPMVHDWSDRPKAEQTRLGLMAAAMAEIYEKGYTAAALTDILARAHATKGALYHHFPDKRSLAVGAMDYFFNTDLETLWIQPFRETDDPMTVLQQLITFLHTSGAIDKGLKNGCPLVNLSEEMAGKDEAFRILIDRTNQEWRDVLADALRRGQASSKVREDIDPDAVATFCLAVRHGVMSQAKIANDRNVTVRCATAFFDYLDTLRPAN